MIIYTTDDTSNEILQDILFESESTSENTSNIATSMSENISILEDVKIGIDTLNENISMGIYFLFVLVMFEILRLVKGTFRRFK